MKPADEIMDSYRKQRSGYGVSTGLLASALIQGMTTDLSIFDRLKEQKSEFDKFFNRNNNYPYSEEYFRKKQKEAIKVFGDAWNQFLEDMRTVNLGNGSGMMNEGLRTTRQNSAEYNSKSRIKS